MARDLRNTRSTARLVRRAWPLVLAAYERWNALSDEEKERYRARARDAVERARRAVENQQRRRRTR